MGEYRQIPSLPPEYIALDDGRVAKVMSLATDKGYHRVRIMDRRYLVHRLIAEAFIGPCPEGKAVAHNNGKRGDNRPENLRYATSWENEADKLLHGTRPQGERVNLSKLTTTDVQDIRRLYALGASPKRIGDLFGVTGENVSLIVKRKTWRHVA